MNQSGKIRDFYIKEALSYIEQNFQNNITIEDIAAFCGLNRSYFWENISRYHRKIATGISDQLPYDKSRRTFEVNISVYC